MAEVELPEIEIDDDNDPFKRRIALLVVAITLFGTIVAVMENRAGNKEEVAARDAQRLAISGLGTRVSTDVLSYALASEPNFSRNPRSASVGAVSSVDSSYGWLAICCSACPRSHFKSR